MRVSAEAAGALLALLGEQEVALPVRVLPPVRHKFSHLDATYFPVVFAAAGERWVGAAGRVGDGRVEGGHVEDGEGGRVEDGHVEGGGGEASGQVAQGVPTTDVGLRTSEATTESGPVTRPDVRWVDLSDPGVALPVAQQKIARSAADSDPAGAVDGAGPVRASAADGSPRGGAIQMTIPMENC